MADPFPDRLEPMLAVPGELPPDSDEWAFEPKWDGIRALAHLRGDGSVVLRSRSLRDITPEYPDLAGLATALGPVPAVLDGELVVLDDAGRPSFQRIQERLQVRAPEALAALVKTAPVTFVVFDVLYLGDRSLLTVPHSGRRRVLEGLEVAGPRWRTAPSFVGAGRATLDAAEQLGLEGVVAKRRSSTYVPGRRSKEWLKVKLVRRDEFVVGGWLPRRSADGVVQGEIGSLALGVPDADGRLRYRGSVGSGLAARDLALLRARLVARPDSPFIAAPRLKAVPTWAEPGVVVEVAYTELTADQHVRQGTYEGLRDDVDWRAVADPAAAEGARARRR